MTPAIESVITEGALTFTFPRHGIASKYDGWSHYRNQFQKVGDSKAVDPRAIEPDKLLLKLKTLLKAIDPHPAVVDKASRIPAMPWSAT